MALYDLTNLFLSLHLVVTIPKKLDYDDDDDDIGLWKASLPTKSDGEYFSSLSDIKYVFFDYR